MSARVGYAKCSPGKMFFTILPTFADLFSVGRATVYRVLERHQNAATPSTPGGQ